MSCQFSLCAEWCSSYELKKHYKWTTLLGFLILCELITTFLQWILFKGGSISVTFFLSSQHFKKTFYTTILNFSSEKVELVIWHIISRMGLNLKYLLRLSQSKTSDIECNFSVELTFEYSLLPVGGNFSQSKRRSAQTLLRN